MFTILDIESNGWTHLRGSREDAEPGQRGGVGTENRGELPLFIIDPQESLTKNNFTILIIKHHSHCRCCSMLQRHTLSLVMHTMSDGIATRPC